MWRVDSFEKTLMVGKIDSKRRRGWQRIRRLDSIAESVEMNLNKLQEIVVDRGAWHAAIHEATESQTWLRHWTKAMPNEIFIELLVSNYYLFCYFLILFFFFCKFLIIFLSLPSFYILPYDPAIPLLGKHTEETRIERDTCTPMFIAALFIIARTWKQPRCPSADEWIRKLWYIYTMEYYSAIKRIHLNQF